LSACSEPLGFGFVGLSGVAAFDVSGRYVVKSFGDY